jgi:hypothetical protein
MQAQFAVHRPAHVRLAPLGVPDQRSTLDAQRERSSFSPAFPAFCWLQLLQLPMMPIERCDADQARIVRCLASSDGCMREHPCVYAMRLPHLRQLSVGLFQAQLLPQLPSLEALHGLDRSQFSQLLVKPVFPDLQWGKAPIPAPLALFRWRLDVLYDEDAHGEELTEPVRQPEFPLPAGFGGRRELLPAVLAILARLAAGGVACPTRAAHLRALPLGFLDACAGIGLEIEIGMCRRCHNQRLLFTPRVGAHRDGLVFSRRGRGVEPDAEEAAFPEGGGLSGFDPATRPRRRRRHQGSLLQIDHRNKQMCHAISLLRVDYIPFAADHRRSCTLGRRAQHPVGRHARMVQLPSDALLRELGQASLAVTLVGSPVASRVASQAPTFYAGVLDLYLFNFITRTRL